MRKPSDQAEIWSYVPGFKVNPGIPGGFLCVYRESGNVKKSVDINLLFKTNETQHY